MIAPASVVGHEGKLSLVRALPPYIYTLKLRFIIFECLASWAQQAVVEYLNIQLYCTGCAGGFEKDVDKILSPVAFAPP